MWSRLKIPCKKAYEIYSKADEKTHKKIVTPGLTAQKQMATCHVVSVTFDHDVFRVTENIRIEKIPIDSMEEVGPFNRFKKGKGI